MVGRIWREEELVWRGAGRIREEGLMDNASPFLEGDL